MWERITCPVLLIRGERSRLLSRTTAERMAERMAERKAERSEDELRLQPLTMDQLVGASWQFADLTFGHGKARAPDRLMSPIKLRKAGFSGCEDTEDAVKYWLREMQKARLLPF